MQRRWVHSRLQRVPPWCGRGSDGSLLVFHHGAEEHTDPQPLVAVLGVPDLADSHRAVRWLNGPQLTSSELVIHIRSGGGLPSEKVQVISRTITKEMLNRLERPSAPQESRMLCKCLLSSVNN